MGKKATTWERAVRRGGAMATVQEGLWSRQELQL